MRQIFTVPARFMVTVIGVAFLGAGIHAAKPGFLAPAAAIIGLSAIVTLLRPLPIGWLRYRAATAGLLFGALALFGAAVDPKDTPVRTAMAPKVVSTQVRAATPAVGKGQAPAARSRSTAKSARSNPLQDRTKKALWIAASKDAVRNRLKDPGSARFRTVVFHAYQGKTPVVCGAVNSKNSFGGYSGYQRFIASGKSLVYLESDLQSGEFVPAWNELCRR